MKFIKYEVTYVVVVDFERMLMVSKNQSQDKMARVPGAADRNEPQSTPDVTVQSRYCNAVSARTEVYPTVEVSYPGWYTCASRDYGTPVTVL